MEELFENNPAFTNAENQLAELALQVAPLSSHTLR